MKNSPIEILLSPPVMTPLKAPKNGSDPRYFDSLT